MYCQHCKTTEGPFVKIAKHTLKDGTIKQRYICNICNSRRQKKYLSTPEGKAASYKAARKYQKNNPVRVAAWKKAASLAAKPCEECGTDPADKHHPDINKPLQVIWLCRYHHKQAHKTPIPV